MCCFDLIFFSKQAMKKQLEKFFRDADVDENGSLTLEELTLALRQQGYIGSMAEIAVSKLYI